MKYVVVDLEMNCVNKIYKKERQISHMETIEIGAVAINEKFQEISSFKTFVKPQYNHEIAKNLQKLTGITTQMVQDAPYFKEAIHQFFDWCISLNDEIQIYQWSESDRDQIVREIELKKYVVTEKEEELLSRWTNFQREYETKLGLDRDISLTDALMFAGKDFDGQAHDALNDARNTAILLSIVKDPEKCRQALSTVIEALQPTKMSTSLGDMFDFSKIVLG